MVAVSAVDPDDLHPSLQPLRWPAAARAAGRGRPARPAPGVDRAAASDRPASLPLAGRPLPRERAA